MKFLVMSVTAGEGHNITASAVKEGFEHLGHECQILDTYDYINRLLAKSLDKGYLSATKYLESWYAKGYKWFEDIGPESDFRTVFRATHAVVAKKIVSYIYDYAPDAIFVTHSFAASLLDVIREKYIIGCKIYGIVTDFCMHPFWEEATHIDYVVVANELMEHQARKKGFDKEQILPFGIPIKLKFDKKCSDEEKRQLKKKHGFDENLLTVIVMGGSMGFGNIENSISMLDSLDLDMQIGVICGKNQKIFNSLSEMTFKKNVRVFGYIDFVDELMECADVFVSKPGGLTTSEALAKGLAMVIVNPIPGIEDRNADFLCNNGVAMRVTDAYDLPDIIFQYFRFPEKLENMRKNIAIIAKPSSTLELCRFAEKRVIKDRLL